MSKTWIGIDAKNALFRFGYANKTLRTSDGKPTGAIHGILKTLLRLKHRYPTARFSMVWDGTNGSAWRKAICPEYKSNRKPNEDDVVRKSVFAQIAPLKRLLDTLKVPNFEIDGIEADDLLSICGQYAIDNGHLAVVYSGDKDFYQLICRGFTVVTKVAKGEGLHEVTKGDVWRAFKCPEEDVVKVRAIAGDSSDHIAPAVHLIGPVKAARLVKAGANPELKSFSDHASGIYDEIKKLEDAWEKVHANYRVMKLPTTYQLRRFSAYQQQAIQECCNEAIGKALYVNYKRVLDQLRELELNGLIADRFGLCSLQKGIDNGAVTG